MLGANVESWAKDIGPNGNKLFSGPVEELNLIQYII